MSTGGLRTGRRDVRCAVHRHPGRSVHRNERRRRLPAILLLAAGAWVTLVACAGREIKVGFVGPLTGVYSDLGVQGRNGAMLAVEEINESGGVEGGRIELLIRDDKNSDQRVVAVDTELAEAGVVAIIGHMTSSASAQAVAVAREHDLVLLSPTASTPTLSDRDDPLFRIQGTTDVAAALLGSWAATDGGFATAASIRDSENSTYGDPFNDAFCAAFTESGGEMLHEVEFSGVGEGDVREELRAVLEGEPETILVIASARDTARIAQALQAGDAPATIVTSGWAATEALTSYGGTAVEGIITARSIRGTTETKAYSDFAVRYRYRFGREPSFAAAQSYDAVRVLATALKRTNGRKEQLAEALTQIEDFPSLHGPLTINEFGDTVAPARLFVMEGGKFRPLRRETTSGTGEDW